MEQIFAGDCLRHLARLEAASVDLAFADPPFNIGWEYDVYNDQQTRRLPGMDREMAGGGAPGAEADRLVLRGHR